MLHSRKLCIVASLFIGIFVLGSFITPSFAQTDELQGKNFDQEYWTLNYSASPPNASERAVDINIAYMNIGGVKTIYLALLNMTANKSDPLKLGYAPFQTTYQYFKVPDGNHVLVQNVFAGLVAYVNNASTNNSVPDASDKIFFSYTLSSNYHRALIRNALSNAIGYDPLGSESLYSYTATPFFERIDNDEKIEYKFGITYENMFILWHPVAIETDDIETTSSAKILFNRTAAFCRLSSLNFTYVLSYNKTADDGKVKMTTEYDIGPITDLYIPYDDPIGTGAIGGIVLNISAIDSGKTLSRYNTTDAITKRLNGTATFGRFSLAVLNYARMIVIENVDARARNRIEEQGAIENANGQKVDPENVNATEQHRIKLRDAVNKEAFMIDFASKPDYILNDDTANPILAPVQLYPKTAIKNPAMLLLYGYANRFIMNYAKKFIEKQYPNADEARLKLRIAAHDGLYYAICFPRWNGLKINQDPTFVAFTDLSSAALGKKIDGFSLSLLLLAALGTAFAVVMIKKRKAMY